MKKIRRIGTLALVLLICLLQVFLSFAEESPQTAEKQMETTEDGGISREDEEAGKIEENLDTEWNARAFSIEEEGVAVMLRAGAGSQVTPPTTVAASDIAPANYLQIIENMPGARAQIIGTGSSVSDRASLAASAASDGGALWNGDWSVASRNRFSNMAAGGRVEAVRFQGSHTVYTYNHSTDSQAGWNSADKSLNTTQMWVDVKYTNAAYYNGEVVDAVARIKVTPMKNRTPGASWNMRDYGNNTYYPILQISHSLYHGWCWQNVLEINVDLKFYSKSGSQIQFPSGVFGDETAAYYTINSLNEARIQDDEQPYPAAYGPEYVFPQPGTVSGVYTVPNCHIETYYDGDTSTGRQYAYNGGSVYWDGDNPTHPNWSLNSVMFTTAQTDHLNFTMGNLSRNPAGSSAVKRTNFVWTSISTQSFSNYSVMYKDFQVNKTWSDPSEEHEELIVDLYRRYKVNGAQKEELVRTIHIDGESGWSGGFYRVPDELSMRKLLAKRLGVSESSITGVEYQIKEREVPGYEASVSKQGTTFSIHNRKVKTGLRIVKKWYRADQTVFQPTFQQPVKVTLKRKRSDQTVDAGFSREIFLRAGEGWQKDVSDLEIRDSNGGAYTYLIEEDVGSLLQGYVLKEYEKNNIQLADDPEQNQLVVANKEVRMDLPVAKIWQDGEENHTADRVTIKLKKNGTLTGQTVLLHAGNNWSSRFTGLPRTDDTGTPISYTVEEVQIAGYISKVEQLQQGGQTAFRITNTPKTYPLVLKKTDQTDPGKKLQGAVFSLYQNGQIIPVYKEPDLSGNPQETVTTGENGSVTAYGIRPGRYTLKEVTAPSGYYLLTDVFQIEVTEEGKIRLVGQTATHPFIELITDTPGAGVGVAVKNSPLYELPSSGGIGTMYFTGAGGLLMGMAALWMWIRKKKEKEDKTERYKERREKMKVVKKVISMMMAIVLVGGMLFSGKAQAAEPTDKANLEVQGLTGNPKVTFYQIASGVYSGGSFVKWEFADNATIADLTKPKSQEIVNIAQKIGDGTITPKATKVVQATSATVTQEVEGAGIWIALITGAEDGTVYNPILLAASYNGEGVLQNGSYDATQNYLYGQTGVAKSSKPTIDKKASGGVEDDGKQTGSIGKELTYTLTPTLPSYPENAKNKTFFVADRLSKGLTFDYESLTITWKGETITNQNGTFTNQAGVVIAKAAQKTEIDGRTGFNLNFDYDKLMGAAPVITYKAVINKDAVVGSTGNTNTVELIYANDPTKGQTHDTPEDKPGTDEASGNTKKDKEEKVYTYQLAFKKTDDSTQAKPLKDAVFGIYLDNKATKLVDIVKTNEKGIALSTHVGKGTYYIKEITAPTGYSLNETIYEVEASWATATTTSSVQSTKVDYTTNSGEAMDKTQVGWIKAGVFYEISQFTEETAATAGAKAAYVKASTTTENSVALTESNPAGSGTVLLAETIKNTKLNALPSTGGMGTYLFTALGVIVMTLAAILFFKRQKKNG
ncbi:Cna B-type domain-containing protein [Clostridiaceae bacterium 68-1-5]|uniref:Cna B-type domain-containing protein n=2 Tax=Suipraeoptans intestinalis TaxID=2606628 RepID=A0A6N7UZT6_9FIRM|nr:Cna B-type domain-containing protein [Suipraeoptans intestinalis]